MKVVALRATASDCGVEKHSIGSAKGWELMSREGMERKPASRLFFIISVLITMRGLMRRATGYQ